MYFMTGDFEISWSYDQQKPLPYWALGEPIVVPGVTEPVLNPNP